MATDSYNTPLTSKEQAGFNAWLKTSSKNVGRELKNDLEDYDLQGYYLSNPTPLKGDAHFPDTYKKPNHPTFSNESMYNGIDGNVGGVWLPSTQGLRYMASPTSNFTSEELQNYFNRVEPGVMLDTTLLK